MKRREAKRDRKSAGKRSLVKMPPSSRLPGDGQPDIVLFCIQPSQLEGYVAYARSVERWESVAAALGQAALIS